MTGEARREEIRAIHKEYKWHYVVMAVVVALGIGIWIGAAVFAEDSTAYRMNLFTEGMGVVASIAVTVFVIDRIYERRNQERQTRELKGRLIRDAGSRSNDIAIAAIDELRVNGWLEGDKGLLKEEDLSEAELQKANLSYSNLARAVFYKANLQDANLAGAILHEASLNDADLERAELLGADLRKARVSQTNLQDAQLYQTDLTGAALIGTQCQRAFLDATNLQGTNLRHADFTNATLTHADLRGANVLDANFTNANLMGARLPDGSLGSAVEMERFTKPNHPDFPATLEKINEIRKAMKLDPIPLP